MLSPSELRARRLKRQPKPPTAKQQANRWETLAHVAAIASSLAAAAALLVSTHQFRENLRLQENVVFLQNRSLQTERATKAAELFEKYLDVRSKNTDLPKGPERTEFYFERNNRGLLLLNAIFSATKGDDEWERIVYWSLQRYEHVAREKKILCLSLTEDFQAFIQKSLNDPPPQMCYDFNVSE